jgi:phenylpyruvate tautomerase PptA (4-oxalocrotonate tautomerase family)
MPNILVKIPSGAFPGDARANLVHCINDAAATAEQMPADPSKRFLSWVVLDEAEAGTWTCGGIDMSSQVLPCIAVVYVPDGVLDEPSRMLYVKLMHDAFKRALPAGEKRQLATSVILHEVPDGAWGGNGVIWTLPKLAKAAGYAHLQHLVAGA